MEGYRSVSVKSDTKQKLKILKSVTGKSYDELISELIGANNGTELTDVITVERNNEALTLNYVENGKAETMKSFIVTYKMLKLDPIGTIYTASENPNRNVEYVNSTCEICYRCDDDVIVMVKEIHYVKGKFNELKSVLHFNLF